MKVTKINVLVNKKVGKGWKSCSISHSASAEIEEGEDWKQASKLLRCELIQMVRDDVPESPEEIGDDGCKDNQPHDSIRLDH